MIYQTRETVFHLDIQAPRRKSNVRRAADNFWGISRCLDSRWNTVSMLIGHFHISSNLFLEARLAAQPFKGKWDFIHLQIKLSLVHMNGCIPSLALMERLRWTRKWAKIGYPNLLLAFFVLTCWIIYELRCVVVGLFQYIDELGHVKSSGDPKQNFIQPPL